MTVATAQGLTALEVVAAAMQELNVLAQGEVPTSGDADFCLKKLNRMIDEWAGQERYVYNKSFTSYVLTPNLQPHTIGPTGATFTVAQRPVKIENANLVLNTSVPSTNVPLNIRDDDWWAKVRVPGVTSTVPTDLYYSPDWPNGSLFLWPVPTFAYGLQLETWGILSQLATLQTVMNLPPGYANAVICSLAERIASGFGAQPSGTLVMEAKNARNAIQGNNLSSPRAMTLDAGMPDRGSRNGGGGFNWITGGPA